MQTLHHMGDYSCKANNKTMGGGVEAKKWNYKDRSKKVNEIKWMKLMNVKWDDGHHLMF